MMKDLPLLSLNELESAAASGALFLMYQPKLDLRSGKVIGVEALARWQDPKRGWISPELFVPAAEETGLIDWFTRWALGTAVRQWSRWRGEGLILDLAVNISALNLRDTAFPDFVSDLCEQAGVPPEGLTLELTETATEEATCLMDAVSRFRLKRFGVSLDDFGTGYASLLQLRSLPFTELKIDRAFVSDLLTSSDSRAITRALIIVAHEMGLTVTAEGVEDAETLRTLQIFGCDNAQGFIIARPMAGDRLSLWMQHEMVSAAISDAPVAEIRTARPADFLRNRRPA